MDAAGEQHVVRARREVVLCGGAYSSPQLLMLSGIGDTTELAAVGIDVVRPLPGVGKGLSNHLQLHVPFEARRPECAINVGDWGEGVGARGSSKEVIEHMKREWSERRSGAGCVPDYRARLCIRTDSEAAGDDAHPNIQAYATPSHIVTRANGTPSVEPAFTFTFNNLRPKSVGRVGLRTDSAADAPLVQQNHLDAAFPEDLKELVDSVKFARRMFAQPALSALIGEELKPGVRASSDAALERFVREASLI